MPPRQYTIEQGNIEHSFSNDNGYLEKAQQFSTIKYRDWGLIPGYAK